VLRTGRAISPVISSIIIVAVAVVIALSAAAWFGGLFGTFTVVERLEITSAYASGPNEITISVKNTGSSTVTIDDVYVNGKPVFTYGAGYKVNGTTTLTRKTLSPGDTVTYRVEVDQKLVGTMVSVGVHTSTGNLVTTSVRL
jgi:archaellum component FlaG (FlaF/FlaG flagellin family)